MSALSPQCSRGQPVWLSGAAWLSVLLSPTGYFLLLMLVDRLRVPAPPEGLVVFLFCFIPIVALVVCGILVWRSKLRVRWRVAWLVLTLLAMSFQVGVLVVIVVMALTSAIALPQ